MTKVGHGDHWLAALDQSDPRLRDALAVPADAPAGLKLHRAPLTEALDMVQVTRDRRLVTSYPEPRATTLIAGRPIELSLWETRAEGWLVLEVEGVGALTVFVTDLAERASRYAAAGAREGIELEVGALAYAIARSTTRDRAPQLRPARKDDARFLPDDYAFEADVVDAQQAGAGEVLDLRVHGELTLPVVARERTGLEAGSRASGYLWLTGRLPP